MGRQLFKKQQHEVVVATSALLLQIGAKAGISSKLMLLILLFL